MGTSNYVNSVQHVNQKRNSNFYKKFDLPIWLPIIIVVEQVRIIYKCYIPRNMQTSRHKEHEWSQISHIKEQPVLLNSISCNHGSHGKSLTFMIASPKKYSHIFVQLPKWIYVQTGITNIWHFQVRYYTHWGPRISQIEHKLFGKHKNSIWTITISGELS